MHTKSIIRHKLKTVTNTDRMSMEVATSLEDIPDALISKISTFLCWKNNELFSFERLCKQIFISVRSAKGYTRLDGKYFIDCLNACNELQCIYPVYRFQKSIQSINIDMDWLYELLIECRYGTERELARAIKHNNEILKTLNRLPVWEKIEQLQVTGFGSCCYEIGDGLILDFLIDEKHSFANLKKLELPGFYSISNIHFMEKFSHIKAFCGNVEINDESVMTGVPNEIESLHGNLQSINSFFKAFRIHKQIKEICIFRNRPSLGGERCSNFKHYDYLVNLERIKLTDGICADMHDEQDIKLLLNQFCRLSKLRYIDVSMNRGLVNFVRLLTVIMKQRRHELIIRYSFSNQCNVNNPQFIDDLTKFVQSIDKKVKHWMVVIKWMDNHEFYKKLNDMSKRMNLSCDCEKHGCEYQVTKKYDMINNLKIYYNTKWIMDCEHGGGIWDVHSLHRLWEVD